MERTLQAREDVLIFHICIRAGDWMFMNWRLYRLRQVTSASGEIKRMAWKCIVSGKEPHSNRGRTAINESQ